MTVCLKAMWSNYKKSALLASDVTKQASMMMNNTFHLNERRPISTFSSVFTID